MVGVLLAALAAGGATVAGLALVERSRAGAVLGASARLDALKRLALVLDPIYLAAAIADYQMEADRRGRILQFVAFVAGTAGAMATGGQAGAAATATAATRLAELLLAAPDAGPVRVAVERYAAALRTIGWPLMDACGLARTVTLTEVRAEIARLVAAGVPSDATDAREAQIIADATARYMDAHGGRTPDAWNAYQESLYSPRARAGR